ncbi:MAG: hypothetical protein KGS72_28735, partial [Cyanobacteria bacterium REEB67]|nr:hypothetical protein [Cyanobacteria bacterium REEB67]
VRHIRADYEPDNLSGAMKVREEGFYPVANGKHHDFVLALDVSHTGDALNSWGGETLLVLLRMQPHPRVLDVADIQMDRESGVWDKPAVLTGGSHDALVTFYSHLNAGEDYLVPGIVEIVGDKFVQSKADLPMAYSARNATAELHESFSFVRSKKGAWPVIFRMKVEAKKVDEDTQKTLKSESKTFSFGLVQKNGRWRCVGDAKPCKAMARLQERFGFSDN